MKPEQVFKAGVIYANVWKNTKADDGKEFHSVSFQKRYKDKDGTWKSTSSLNQTDVPKAVMVLNKAYEYLTLQEEHEAPLESGE